MSMPKIIKTRQVYVRKQIDNVRSFITTPKGVFETIDEMIKTFRSANKATLRNLPVPSVKATRLLEKLRL